MANHSQFLYKDEPEIPITIQQYVWESDHHWQSNSNFEGKVKKIQTKWLRKVIFQYINKWGWVKA